MISSDEQYQQNYSIPCKYLSNVSCYNQITILNLSNLQLVNIDSFPFEQYPDLHSLDLSYNQLTTINCDWSKLFQNKIQYLNLSHNKLQSLLFLKDFKYLNTLNVTNNLLRNNERFLSLNICPTIEHLIDADQEQIHLDQLKLDHLLSLIQANINHLWSLLNFNNKKKTCKRNQTLTDDFRESCIKFIEQETIFFEFHLSSSGNYFLKKKIDEFYLQLQETTIKTSLIVDFKKCMTIQDKPKHSFEPIKFIRCHHKSHDDDDLLTIPVLMCAFEPNTSTNMLATCGGQKVCFIDCNTCEVTHLFEVNTLQSTITSRNRMVKNKNRKTNMEHFTCLCWIEIEDNSNDSLKVLVVGSASGHIYLLSHKWKLMFGHIELPASSISCLTWHASNPYSLAIGSYHHVRFINIRSYIDRLQSFTRKQRNPTVQFDYMDTSMFINKVPTTHIYNLYSGEGPLIKITDLLFYSLSKTNIILLVGTTSGIFVIKCQDKEQQQQSPIQLAFPKSIWSTSEHVESFCIMNHFTHHIAMNILGFDQIICFNLEKSLQDQQLHVTFMIPNPSRKIPTKLTLFPINRKTKDSTMDSFECIIGSNDHSFYHHEIETSKSKSSTLKSKHYEIECEPNENSTSSNILSSCLNEHYLCLTTNNNLICLYKRHIDLCQSM